MTPHQTPRSERESSAIFEFKFTRHRVADPLGAVRSPADVTSLLRDYVRPDEAEQERLVVAFLNVKNVVIGVETLYLGTVSGSSVRVGEVFRGAVRVGASSIVVSHNHPSGDPLPSADDIAITREIAAAGRILDISLLDHVILGSQDRSASMRALGHLG